MFSDILPIWGCSEDKDIILILGSESLLTHILRFLRSVIDISKLNEVDQESIASLLLDFLFSCPKSGFMFLREAQTRSRNNRYATTEPTQTALVDI